jgi:hypothetical protein
MHSGLLPLPLPHISCFSVLDHSVLSAHFAAAAAGLPDGFFSNQKSQFG